MNGSFDCSAQDDNIVCFSVRLQNIGKKALSLSYLQPTLLELRLGKHISSLLRQLTDTNLRSFTDELRHGTAAWRGGRQAFIVYPAYAKASAGKRSSFIKPSAWQAYLISPSLKLRGESFLSDKAMRTVLLFWWSWWPWYLLLKLTAFLYSKINVVILIQNHHILLNLLCILTKPIVNYCICLNIVLTFRMFWTSGR